MVHQQMPTEGRLERAPARVKERRKRRRLIAIFIVLLLAYPVLGTLALWTGLAEKLIASEDLRVELGKPAYTIFPGRVHIKNARILSNGETQFELAADNLEFEVRLLGLLKKKIYVASVFADNVRYRMRVQVADTKGIEERVAAYPKLEDLPGKNTVVIQTGAKTEEREGDYTVQVEGIDVKLSELWFFEYRYLGDGTLRGGFMVGPNVMRVDTSVQEVGPGELRFGREQVIAKEFGGRIEAAIPQINPEERADESFLELVDAKVHLKGDIVTLQHLRAYLDGMTVDGGAGPLEAKLSMHKGRLGDQSRITFNTDEVTLHGEKFSVRTDWDLAMHVGPPEAGKKGPPPTERRQDGVLPRIRSACKATYVSFANERKDVFTIQVRRHDEGAVLKTTQLGRMTDIAHAYLRMPEIVTNDLDDLAAFSSKKTPIESTEGEASASLSLDVDENHVARGPFKARVDGVRFAVEDVKINGRASASFRIRHDFDDKATTLDDISIALSEVGMHVGDEDVEGWWLRLSAKQLAAWGLPPKRVETKLVLRAKDAEPILEGLAEKDKINDLIAKFTSLDDLRARAEIRKNGPVTDVLLDPFESDVFDAAGRIHLSGEESRFAVVIGGKAVSLGIAKDPSGLTLAPMARTGWLNEELRGFPKPVEQVTPSQP